MQRRAKYGNEIVGRQFGELTAVKQIGVFKGGYHWEFKCSCGRTCKRLLSGVMANSNKGFNVSCGCRRKSLNFQEKASKNRRKKLSQKVDKNNTSGITGVCYDKCRDKWLAYLEINRVKHRRSFKGFNEAVICRKEWEKEYGMYENL